MAPNQDANGDLGIRDPFLAISKKEVPGTDFMLKFGENNDIDSATFEDVWDGGGVYVPPTQARLHNVISTLAADTGSILSSGNATGGSSNTIIDTGATFQTDLVAVGDVVLNDSKMSIAQVISIDSEIQLTVDAWNSPNDGFPLEDTESGDAYRVVTNGSTGASIFHILGQDASRLEIEEFVVLNGTNNVVTANSYSRQYRARVFGPGTTGAVGVITSTAQTDNTVSCQIDDGANQTLMAVYSIPLNKTGYLVHWWGSMAKSVGVASVSVVRLRAGTKGGIGYLLQSRTIANDATSSFDYDWQIPAPIPGGVDIWVEANASAADTGVSAGFDIILVDN